MLLKPSSTLKSDFDKKASGGLIDHLRYTILALCCFTNDIVSSSNEISL